MAAGALHLAGERRVRRPRRRAGSRALFFYSGLLAILIALAPQVDALADRLFWAHMIQHLLLLVVATPLIVLGRPWFPLARPFPVRVRRAFARTLLHSPALAPARGLFRVLTRPPGAWLAFTGTLVLWHLPDPYDLTLRNTGVHILEHASFLLFGMLFWAQVIGSSRPATRLSHARRIGYVAAAVMINVGLSIFLAFAQHPPYSPYGQLTSRPGGISALADQQIGAGIMWTAGDLPFAIAIAILVQGWLAVHEAMTPRPEGQSQCSSPATRDPG